MKFVIVFSLLLYWIHGEEPPHLINLDVNCLYCLCYAATGCNLTIGCDKGYCGPYKISRIFWKDSDQPILEYDDKERDGAYEDCANAYNCAQRIVINYLIRYGRDCNDDGLTNCEDYSMINFNGGFQCHQPLDRNEPGKEWLKRYNACSKIQLFKT